MKRMILTGSLAAALCLMGCAPAPQETATPVAEPALVATDTPAPEGKLTQNYMDAATALYNDDFDSAKKLLAAFAGESTGEVQTMASAAADAKDLAAMRESFRQLSDLAAKMELPADYAVAYCPMFKSGTRAHWVQKKGDLMNPYFGKSNAMSTCGTFVN